MSCHISRDTNLHLALDCYEKLSPVNRGVRVIRSFLLRSQKQPRTNASRALFMAGQGGWSCTLIVLARTSWNFFPQFSYIFWPSLTIQHKVYILFCLLAFLVWLWNEKSCKKWRIQTFHFDFHEVLVLLTSQSCVFRYSFFMDFDLCSCRQPLSEAKIITDYLTYETGTHATLLFLETFCLLLFS